MATRVEAIFEDGVLRPLTPPGLMAHERVMIIVEQGEDDVDHEYVARCRAELAGLERLSTLEEPQAVLSARGGKRFGKAQLPGDGPVVGKTRAVAIL